MSCAASLNAVFMVKLVPSLYQTVSYQYSFHITQPPTREYPLSRWNPGDQLHQKVIALFMQPNSQHKKQFNSKGEEQVLVRIQTWLYPFFSEVKPEASRKFLYFWSSAEKMCFKIIMLYTHKVTVNSNISVFEELTDLWMFTTYWNVQHLCVCFVTYLSTWLFS